MYLHYYAIIIILVEKWSQNDNIIVYLNNFWDNLLSRKCVIVTGLLKWLNWFGETTLLMLQDSSTVMMITLMITW